MRNRAIVGGIGFRGGFTLVELLIVITIIGILVGLLLPAVNSARESGRSAQCKNNLIQLGRAVLAHEEAQGIFPTGGWGWYWVGDPDRGFGEQQPGGWLYNILPNTDMNQVHNLGQFGTFAQKQAGILQMVSTPWPVVMCPTRRRASLYLNNWEGSGSDLIGNNAGGTSGPAGFKVARSDYAISCGSANVDENSAGPSTGADWPYGASEATMQAAIQVQNNYFKGRTTGLGYFQTCTGISFERSTIRKDDITDGCSSTLLAGEKYLDMDNYGSGESGCDNENLYVGFDNDIGRTTYTPPMRDTVSSLNPNEANACVIFGSSHPNAANFVMCDGHTFTINYGVNPFIFQCLGTRAGNDTVDLTQL